MTVVAVLVTFNRLNLLKKAVSAVENQTRKPDHIVIVDNGSTDGTSEWLSGKKNVVLVQQDNIGSAGGQNSGIKAAIEHNADWIWCMDDDVEPNPSSLAELEQAAIKHPNSGFLNSLVIGDDGITMNVPIIDFSKNKNFYPGWGDKLADNLLKINCSTFVSLFVNRNAIEKVGLPIKDFFIWNDDYEFTLRISKYFENFLVSKSIVVHKRVISAPPGIIIENNPNRIANYFYLYRNKSYVRRKHIGFIAYLDFLTGVFSTSFSIITSGKFKFLKLKTILRGVISGFFFNPSIEKI